MRNLFWFALIAVAAWYGWNHWRDLRRPPTDEIVLVNRAGVALERVRIGVGDDVVVFEAVEDATEQRRPWHGRVRGEFVVQWDQRGQLGEHEWHGTVFEPSATPFTHTFEFQRDARVTYRSERIPVR